MTITENDLLDAIRAALATPTEAGDGFTGPELAEAAGKSTTTVRQALKRLLASGTAEVVQLRRMKINGQAATVPGYRLKNGKP